jgi:predicted DNA-binding protein
MTWGAKKNVSHALRVVQVARLKEHSALTGLSISRIVREAVDAYLDKSSRIDNVDAAINALSSAMARLEEIRNGRR